MAHFFDTPNYWNQISLKAVGAAQPGINASKLKEILIPLPPLAKQKRIAAILDQADELRRKRLTAINSLSQLRASVFDELMESQITGKERFPTPLDRIANVLVGFPFPSSAYSENRASVRLCRGANVLPGQIDWGDVVYWPESDMHRFSEYDLATGDIIVAMDRPWISSGFKIAIISPDDLPCLLVQRVARIRAKNPSEAAFLYELLRGPAFSKHCKPTETTVPHISPKEVRNFPVCLPERALVEKFGEQISRVVNLQSTQIRDLKVLNSLFTSLQQRAFRGELTPHQAERELAAAQ